MSVLVLATAPDPIVRSALEAVRARFPGEPLRLAAPDASAVGRDGGIDETIVFPRGARLGPSALDGPLSAVRLRLPRRAVFVVGPSGLAGYRDVYALCARITPGEVYAFRAPFLHRIVPGSFVRHRLRLLAEAVVGGAAFGAALLLALAAAATGRAGQASRRNAKSRT